MNTSGLFVFKIPGKDQWQVYDGRVPTGQMEMRMGSPVLVKSPIKLGVFDTEADAWLCINELQRKENNENKSEG